MDYKLFYKIVLLLRLNMTQEYAQLKIADQIYQLPILKSSIGYNVIDIAKLYSMSGFCMLDAGFMSTASCESKITYIDGEKGILRYRGYDIKTLAQKSNFLQSAYLLLCGDLPNKSQYENFAYEISHHSLINQQMHNLFMAFRHSAHPMAIMLGAVGCLSAFYHDCLDIHDANQRQAAAIKIIAKMPTIAAMAYKYSIGQPFMHPRNDLSFTENFLHMMFATPCEPYQINPVVVQAMDKIFLLHADHEQNASTSTVRTVGSSGANPFACISAGIASLWGPAHGGANEAVIHMLKQIGDVSNIPTFIAKAKDKDDPFKLMGFGHRVYKNYDPRAAILKESCAQILLDLKHKDDKLLHIATELEEIALHDEYFIQRKLYPNVDFYSGIIYQAIGIPSQMFTVLFAVARTVGWIAQWKEMLEDENFKIARPRQLYSGCPLRDIG